MKKTGKNRRMVRSTETYAVCACAGSVCNCDCSCSCTGERMLAAAVANNSSGSLANRHSNPPAGLYENGHE